MRHLLFIICFLALPFLSSAQQYELEDFNQKRKDILKEHAFTVGAWSIGNLAYSGARLGFGNPEGATKYALQANIGWNVVNLGLVLPSLLRQNAQGPENFDLEASIREQLKAERIILTNGVLNLFYIAGGVYFIERGNNRNNTQLVGFGRGLIIQGSFLLLADTFTFIRLKSHSDTLWDQVSFEPFPGGFSARLRF